LAIEHYRLFGEKDWIIESLRRSDVKLTMTDRNLVADLIEGKIKLPRGRPPRAHLLHGGKTVDMEAAANEVARLKAEWRAAGGKVRGTHDRAIEMAVKKYCPPDKNPLKFEEQLRTLVKRPKKVRGAR
jgi:hypothetical protein